jgi:hypothetical protein
MASKKGKSSIETPISVRKKTNDYKSVSAASNTKIGEFSAGPALPRLTTNKLQDFDLDDDNLEEEKKEIGKLVIPASLCIATSESLTHSRPFPPSWLQIFPWLFYDEKKNVMICKFCLAKNKSNKFARGSNRFKIDGPAYHSRTSQHHDAIELTLASNVMKQTLDAFWASRNTDLVKLLMHVKFICDENLPISTFASLCAHLKRVGHYYKSSLYMNHYGFMEICRAASSIFKEHLIENIKKSPFYSLILDETTDLMSVKELGVMVKFYDSKRLCSRTEFLCLIPIEQSDAKFLRVQILSLLHALGLNIECLVGVGTDGASVMVGRDKGLCTRLIKRAPFALQNHCIAHRLNLAYKDSERDTADDNFEALKDLDSLTRELYSFFKKSPQKCLDLEKFARLKKQPAYKMLKVYDVRWLSKFNAIENIRKNLEALLSLLRNYMNINESDLSSKSASLYKKITNPSIVFLLYILSDVLFDVMTFPR